MSFSKRSFKKRFEAAWTSATVVWRCPLITMFTPESRQNPTVGKWKLCRCWERVENESSLFSTFGTSVTQILLIYKSSVVVMCTIILWIRTWSTMIRTLNRLSEFNTSRIQCALFLFLLVMGILNGVWLSTHSQLFLKTFHLKSAAFDRLSLPKICWIIAKFSIANFSSPIHNLMA